MQRSVAEIMEISLGGCQNAQGLGTVEQCSGIEGTGDRGCATKNWNAEKLRGAVSVSRPDPRTPILNTLANVPIGRAILGLAVATNNSSRNSIVAAGPALCQETS